MRTADSAPNSRRALTQAQAGRVWFTGCGSLLAALSSRRVKLSVKSDYAARAVFGLARHFQAGEALKVEQLAAENAIPKNFLVQILLELKARQIVKSVRGKEGGYLLARPPEQVTLGDVLRCFHGDIFDTPALSDPKCPPEVRHAWETLQRSLDQTADGLTFQQMLDESLERKMFYI